jgi:hypothetical protein
VVSLLANLGLCAFAYQQNLDLTSSREAEAARQEERDFLMELILLLNPSVSKPELSAILKRMYPDELVDDSDDQVQWRLFHFWFDANGKLKSVQWSS